MRKALPITVILLLLTLSMTQFANAQQAKANIITNQTTEDLYVVSSTKYGAEGAIPEGYRTSGWKTITTGQEKTFWAYDPNKIYFQIFKGTQPIKPQPATGTFAFWINRNANFNIVTPAAINANITRDELVYSSHDTNVLTQSDGFMVFDNGSRITVTNAWVPVSQRAVPNTAVNIPDPALRAEIEIALDKNPGDTITEADMLALTILSAAGRDIEDLTGLEAAENLTSLDLGDNNISDISPLSGLTRLTDLFLFGNRISDFSPIAGILNNLLAFDFANQRIVDPNSPAVNIPDAALRVEIEIVLGKEPGAKITQADMLTLITLNASWRDIEDLTGLEAAENLTELDLGGNNISDISALSGMNLLLRLDLYDNDILDIAPLSNLTTLKWLSLDRNNISDISVLSGLMKLIDLGLSENRITDVSPLAGLINLEFLNLSENRISDFSPIAGLIPNLAAGYEDGGQEDDGFSSATGTVPKIYWTEGWGETPGAAKIRRADLDGSNVEDILTNQMAVTRLSVDAAGGKLYWMDGHGDGTPVFINRSNLDGSNLETLVRSNQTNKFVYDSLTLDIANGKIYWMAWTNQNETGAWQADLDGSNARSVDVIPEHLHNNVVAGKKYWHDRDRDTILRSNLDGSNVEDLVSEQFVPELAVDGISGKIYWHNYNQLRRANLDGSNVENLLDEDDVSELTIDGAGGKMYWQNFELSALRRANLDGSNVESIVSNVGFTLSIAVLPDVSTSTPPLPETTETNATVSLSPASVASPAVGQQLTFSLNITNSKNVVGYQAIVNFDPVTLRYVESANGDYLPAGAFFVTPTVSADMPGTFTLAATAIAGSESQGDGTLATFTFEVLQTFPSWITLSDVVLINKNGDTSYPEWVDAEITERLQFPEDVNQDGIVDIVDLTLVASNLNKQGQLAEDVNGDGVVDIVDLTLVAGAFGAFAASPSVWLDASDVSLSYSDVASWLRQARAANISTPSYQRGLEVLEQLLAALIPTETTLLANYPNPFNPETWLPYHLAEPADVTLTIYAIDGKVVRHLDLGHQAAGYYQNKARAVYWDGRNAIGERVVSGLYFYTLTAGDFAATRKMLIRK